MAADNRNITLVPGVPTELTTSNCTTYRAVLLTDGLVSLMGTTGAAPANFGGAMALVARTDTILGSVTMASQYPHAPTANRVWALANYPAVISFSQD